MMDTLCYAMFYVSTLLLTIMCIVTANNMSASTCLCLRFCLKLIMTGLICLVLAVFYDINVSLLLLCLVPIIWGVSGWLFFDRYRVHEDIDAFKSKCRNYLNRIKEFANIFRRVL